VCLTGILKVIAKIICQSKPCDELDDVRKLFLDDLIALCEDNEDNRRYTVYVNFIFIETLLSALS